MKMKFNPFVLTLLICWLIPWFAIGEVDELKANEKHEISLIVAPVEEIIVKKHRITAEKMKIYASHLVKLEAAVAKSGDLDAAMKVRAERDNYEKGTATPGFDAGGKPALLQVAIVRSKLDEQLQTLDRQASRALERSKIEAVKALNSIKVQLTRSGRLNAALEVDQKIKAMQSWTIATAVDADSGETDHVLTAASTENPFVNSLRMKFVPVPITGGPTDGRRILFCIWETRMKDFEKFLKQDRKIKWDRPVFKIDDDHPAPNVSWEEASAFCEWLTETERRNRTIGENQRYRLPTDHEWSCAVGIGKEEHPDVLPKAKNGKLPGVYPWGSDLLSPEGTGNYYGKESEENPHLNRKTIDGYEDPFDRTAPVGSFPPNEFGLYDLSGNVWEWCEDWFSGEKKQRVRRGGSWFYDSRNDLLSSTRNPRFPDAHVITGGFRCVLE